jgi:hypothetical protein
MGSLKSGLIVLALCGMTACGGGGSDAGKSPFGSASTPSVSSPTLDLTLSSPTPTASAPATVTAIVKTAAGAAAVGEVVFFFSLGNLGVFDSPSALTNAGGIATVQLSPASPAASGIDKVFATVTVNQIILSKSIGFQVSP